MLFLSSTAMPYNWLIHLSDPWPWPEGSMNQGLSVLPFRDFLGIDPSPDFLVMGSMCDRAGFFVNNIIAPKMGKMGQK